MNEPSIHWYDYECYKNIKLKYTLLWGRKSRGLLVYNHGSVAHHQHQTLNGIVVVGLGLSIIIFKKLSELFCA